MNEKDKNKNNKNKAPQKNPFFVVLIISIVATVLLNFFLTSVNSPKTKEIAYSEFLVMIKSGEVEEVSLSADKITIVKKKQEVQSTTDKLMKLWGGAENEQEICYICDERIYFQIFLLFKYNNLFKDYQ